jgi:hypothetical protein
MRWWLVPPSQGCEACPCRCTLEPFPSRSSPPYRILTGVSKDTCLSLPSLLGIFPNIRVNPFPQIHEPSESPSYFVYISQHEPPHSTPKLAGRSSPTSVSLSRTRTASRSSNENAPDGNTIPEATKTQDGDSQFSYSRHVCIHCLYCLSNGIF